MAECAKSVNKSGFVLLINQIGLEKLAIFIGIKP
jgi:hypothetical protein